MNRFGVGLLLACLAIAGCGGQAASPGERAAVKEIVPAAEQIRCDQVDATLTRCHAVVGNALMGSTWTCDLREYASRGSVAYSGSRSCWTSRD